QDEQESKEEVENVEAEKINFKLMFNKQKLEIAWDPNKTIKTLKTHIQSLTGVGPGMQKLMFKENFVPTDDQTLSEAGIVNGSKLMLVGSKLTDVISVNAKSSTTAFAQEAKSAPKEPLSKQKPHEKVIKHGVPDDAMVAYKNGHENLPIPIHGMVNKHNNKVRLTFKLESDQLWIGTKDRTEKLSMNSIKQVVTEPIAGHEEYHMMALQLGPTEQSRYWIYWVPAQYVRSIKTMILGQWPKF
uniref:Ubiquitin-like domain-containing protein n=1 Tax=Ciona savignyi TaxID=51511 RepID=H2YJ85_CIOSA